MVMALSMFVILAACNSTATKDNGLSGAAVDTTPASEPAQAANPPAGNTQPGGSASTAPGGATGGSAGGATGGSDAGAASGSNASDPIMSALAKLGTGAQRTRLEYLREACGGDADCLAQVDKFEAKLKETCTAIDNCSDKTVAYALLFGKAPSSLMKKQNICPVGDCVRVVDIEAKLKDLGVVESAPSGGDTGSTGSTGGTGAGSTAPQPPVDSGQPGGDAGKATEAAPSAPGAPGPGGNTGSQPGTGGTNGNEPVASTT
jgi:hypothetical protein